jgi:hypothetical protein
MSPRRVAPGTACRNVGKKRGVLDAAEKRGVLDAAEKRGVPRCR